MSTFKCYICETPMNEITVDPVTLKPEECSRCKEAIWETVMAYDLERNEEEVNWILI